jgi:hypothetical protein
MVNYQKVSTIQKDATLHLVLRLKRFEDRDSSEVPRTIVIESDDPMLMTTPFLCGCSSSIKKIVGFVT